MHPALRAIAPWLHLALDHVLAFVGLLSFSFIGLLGALNKLKVRMLPFLVGATIIWVVSGMVLLVGEVKLVGVGNLLAPASKEATLALQFIKRVSFAWFAGSAIGAGLVAITILFEKYSKSRAAQLVSLAMRTAVFAAAFWIYLRTYVL